MDKFFDPCFDIVMNWASHFGKPRFNKILSLILKILGKEHLYCSRPETLSSTPENLLHLKCMVQTSYSDGFYMLYFPNFKFFDYSLDRIELLAKKEVSD